MSEKMFTALGLMSGTSMDGIDAAIVRTDGGETVEPIAFQSFAYPEDFRERLWRLIDTGEGRDEVERDLTERHAEAVTFCLKAGALLANDLDLIGFHGHTIDHAPAEGRTVQIGDGQYLASRIGVPVINDFRTNDVAQGGEGAPFAPAYHRILTVGMPRPTVVLNLGGVGNVTWIGGDGEGALLAFDTGPGNALIDDWVLAATGEPYDDDGNLAAMGTVDRTALAALLAHPYFQLPPPKSLDRNDFDPSPVNGLSLEDGAATLGAFTVETIARATAFFPAPALRWIVCGGGRKNSWLIEELSRALGVDVDSAEEVGWNGDAVEAEAFAFLAVRSHLGLPLSYPGTTKVPAPATGGVRHDP